MVCSRATIDLGDAEGGNSVNGGRTPAVVRGSWRGAENVEKNGEAVW